MFGLSIWEILTIGVVALLVFGPDKLPQVVQKMTGFARDVQKTALALKSSVHDSVSSVSVDDIVEIQKETPQEEVHHVDPTTASTKPASNRHSSSDSDPNSKPT